MALGATLTYSIVGSANEALLPALHQLLWAGFVLSSFPRAMLIMAGSFGVWRAGIISSRIFAVGVTAVVLGVLGGTTRMSSGFWAADGACTRIVFPLVGLAWLVAFGAILNRAPATRGEW